MRILTNNNDLPLPIVEAIRNDSYVPHGDISVTTLIDSPYLRLLRKNNSYEEDASELIWAVMGQALHYVIERAGKKLDSSFFYPEFKMEIKIDGKILSGTSDLVEKKEVPMYDKDEKIVGVGSEFILHDYKQIFSWSAKLGKDSPHYEHWKLQTNIYRLMAKYGRYVRIKDGQAVVSEKKIGIDISKIYIHAFIRDWKKSEMKRIKNYPKAAVTTIEVEVMPEEEVILYIRERMKLHFIEGATEKDYPHCNKEERWSRPPLWKVVKIGGKRAITGGNFSIKSKEDELQAMNFFAENLDKYKGKLKIEKFEGEDIRCQDYCSVCQFCKYYLENYNSYGERKGPDNGAENGALPESEEGDELSTPELDF